MKEIFFCMGFALLSGSLYAQKNDKALHVGDQMPAYHFPIVINSAEKRLDLKKYSGKLVILDFWNTYCGQCISLMPHLQGLQNHFRDQLQIITVDDYKSDDAKKINHIIANIKKNYGVDMNIPYALYNPLMLEYFPQKGVPHEVIISPQGKIIAITFDTEITKQNIQALLDGKKVDFPLKDDFWNNNVPIVSQTNTSNSQGILLSSSLTGYIPFIEDGGGDKKNDKGEVIGKLDANWPLIHFYTTAYPDLFKDNPIQKFETSDPLFEGDIYNDKSKLFNYDFIFQAGKYTEEKYMECLRQDLDRIFNFSLRRGKKSVPCLVLKTNKNIANIYTKSQRWEGNIDHYTEAIKNHVAIYGHKYSIGFLSELLRDKTFKNNDLLIKDESGDDHEIDLDFPKDFDFTNKGVVLAFLHEKGIDYTIEDREVDCVIVSDKKPGEPTVLNQ
jgi:thiol-disulfide isomerase/thioredoxin